MSVFFLSLWTYRLNYPAHCGVVLGPGRDGERGNEIADKLVRDGSVQQCTERRGGSNPSPPEIPKALQNRVKLNPIVKTVKNY